MVLAGLRGACPPTGSARAPGRGNAENLGSSPGCHLSSSPSNLPPVSSSNAFLWVLGQSAGLYLRCGTPRGLDGDLASDRKGIKAGPYCPRCTTSCFPPSPTPCLLCPCCLWVYRLSLWSDPSYAAGAGSALPQRAARTRKTRTHGTVRNSATRARSPRGAVTEVTQNRRTLCVPSTQLGGGQSGGIRHRRESGLCLRTLQIRD